MFLPLWTEKVEQMISKNTLADFTAALLVALEAKAGDTGSHARRVAEYSLEIGRQLGLSQPHLFALKFGALLHDVGKIRTPDAVLNKPGRLTPDEWTIMRQHPSDGAAMLRALRVPPEVWGVVAEHHENFDGSGYPNALAGTQISIEARIFAVADTYDAITRDRCYRKGAASAVARHEIASWSGRQFDPDVVAAFLECESFKNLASAA
jgi:putative nucleotidyltransferase with HDIG domain